MKKFAATLILLMALSVCAREAHLYPVTSGKNGGSVLTLHFMSYGTGNGEVELPMPNGEVLRGEYSIVRNGTIGFGAIIGSVYGKNGSTSFAGVTPSYQMEGGSPGVASAVGPKGTIAQCEFYNDNLSGHGYGACKISPGKTYRLQY